MLRDVEVDDAPAVVSEHDENEEDTKASGRHGEEVDRDQVAEMVSEERSPRLRRPGTPLRHEPRDGALGYIDAEFQEFAMAARGTPEGIRGSHTDDQRLDLSMDLRPAPVLAARELR